MDKKELQKQIDEALIRLKINTPKRRGRWNHAIKNGYSRDFAAIYALQEG